jgi:HEAT repeat protein
MQRWIVSVAAVVAAVVSGTQGRGAPSSGPYQRQVDEQLRRLDADAAEVRAAAAEALGFLRAYQAEPRLLARLDDASADVRTRVALALAWCGGRRSVEPLLRVLDDHQWTVRQAAWVALTNLTGMEWPFDALGPEDQQAAQVRVWRDGWRSVASDRPPAEVLKLLEGAAGLGFVVTASTTYKGPPDVLADGRVGPPFWQTKNVAPPQWCQIDLRRTTTIDQVVVHQYGPGFCMKEYELATSVDGEHFDRLVRRREKTPPRLVIDFAPRKARYVRLTSFGSERKTFPTTIFEVEVNPPSRQLTAKVDDPRWRLERGLRALGALGGRGATAAVIECLGPVPAGAAADRRAVFEAIRALGRLRERAGFNALVSLLEQPMWARYAAEALGDFGDRRAVPALLAAYARYAKLLDGKDPVDVPRDDKTSFPSEDRMLETPYAIAYALSRLPLDGPDDRAALRRLAPLLMANLPGDHDTFMLYQPEVAHLLTRHLMEQSGMRQEAVEQAMQILGEPRRVAAAEELAWPPFDARRVSSWLPAVCTDKADVPRLLRLVGHPNGWVRINAAKTLAWIGDRRVADALAKILADAKTEADYGYSPLFKDEEFDDPCPRWREAIVRALGLLGGVEHTAQIVRVMNDERSVLEVRHAAAETLADLGNSAALAALAEAAARHSFLSVRNVAHDALHARGMRLDGENSRPAATEPLPAETRPVTREFDSLVFVRGDNVLENNLRTVTQADWWRQTYAVTDEGPCYRPGRNLYVLSPPRPDGRARPLTRFHGGYVGEPELSWDAGQVVFTHRTQDNPWWHIWRVRIDGSGLEQLTDGPYHDVGPAFLPDGRIVFASSRAGIRDEYHGYPCTALWVMDAQGRDLHPIATNIGRDNEPAVMPDGRIVFSRLEVFYSRNKTELTLHAAHADGTLDTVLYGPERRAFWRNLDHGMRSPADGQESPLTHRVLRVTQPQPMPDGRTIIVSTQGGLTLIGPCRDRETIITPDNKNWAYTTPYPLADGTILCAATRKVADPKQVDLALYRFDPARARLDLIYNDPLAADYEPRPVLARPRPAVAPAVARRLAYSGRLVCASVLATQEPEVARRGRLVRLVEGTPVVGRHCTHTGSEPVWKNHGGTLARVLGMAPLAADGSFSCELPADRLVHFQVLDSDRRAVGNQLTWISVRPGETKSCAGCHENRHTTPTAHDPLALHQTPLRFLPTGNEFSYRAKAWMKGSLPAEVEEQTRTVRAVNLLGRQ